MPAASTNSHGASRTSFYGRRCRASSSGSSASSSSSHGAQSAASGSTGMTSVASTSKVSSSSSHRSTSPASKKQVAVATAASAASKKLQVSGSTNEAQTSAKAAAINSLRQESGKDRLLLDEQEYQEAIISHMHHMEEETVACVDLMDAQPELRWYMRPYLVDFIVEIHTTFRLRPETLFLTMNIVDRYVSKRIVYKRHYQLVGCAALLIASKFEDAKDKVPLVSELAQMCCSAYDESAFVQMEGHVLSTIGWTLGYPTPEAWLRLACSTNNQAPQVIPASVPAAPSVLSTLSGLNLDSKTLNVTRFLLEITLFNRDFIGLLPSDVTAGSLLLARIIVSGGKEAAALKADASPKAYRVAQLLDTHLTEHAHELSEILVKKYSFMMFCCASNVVVQWYITVAAQRDVQQSVLGNSIVPSLFPAVIMGAAIEEAQASQATPVVASVPAMAPSSAAAPAMTKSTSASSFSTPRRSSENVGEVEDDEDENDDNVSMHSSSTTPSSVISTPSQMSTDGEEEDDEDDINDGLDDEEDEESDMPVTPLSLNSLHDPLVAAEVKEDGGVASQPSAKATNHNSLVPGIHHHHTNSNKHLQPRDDRRALALSQHDNRMVM